MSEVKEIIIEKIVKLPDLSRELNEISEIKCNVLNIDVFNEGNSYFISLVFDCLLEYLTKDNQKDIYKFSLVNIKKILLENKKFYSDVIRYKVDIFNTKAYKIDNSTFRILIGVTIRYIY